MIKLSILGTLFGIGENKKRKSRLILLVTFSFLFLLLTPCGPVQEAISKESVSEPILKQTERTQSTDPPGPLYQWRYDVHSSSISEQSVWSVIECGDGMIGTAGVIMSGGYWDWHMRRLETDGSEHAVDTYGGTSNDKARAMVEVGPHDDLAITGYVITSSRNIAIRRLDSGVIGWPEEWTEVWTWNGDQLANTLHAISGGYVLAGRDDGGSGSWSFGLFKAKKSSVT